MSYCKILPHLITVEDVVRYKSLHTLTCSQKIVDPTSLKIDSTEYFSLKKTPLLFTVPTGNHIVRIFTTGVVLNTSLLHQLVLFTF